MKFVWTLLFVLILPINSFSRPINTEKLKWGDLEVTFVEDNKLPLYSVQFYFADGAASDDLRYAGETAMTFDLLKSGTRSFNQKEINDNLEYYGSSLSFDVTHEYVIGGVSGLIKDIIPTMKQVCHLFNDATFPENELKKEIKVRVDSLKSMVTSHDSIADRAFRELSLDGSIVKNPVNGKVATLSRINRNRLENKLQYFKNNVQKRLYISGPKEALIIKDTILHECGFEFNSSRFVRNITEVKTPDQQQVYLVTVPNANQAQLRVGRILNEKEISKIPLLMFTSKFLGGGFTSQLMKAVRVEKGLSYSVSAFAAGQRGYGRSGISSFTKNETIVELINTIEDTLSNVSNRKFTEEEFELSRGYLIGSYPFNFETSTGFMGNLIQLDHAGISIDEFYNLPSDVNRIKREDVSQMTRNLFNWQEQVIVVLGAKNLEGSLKKKFKNVKVMDWTQFL